MPDILNIQTISQIATAAIRTFQTIPNAVRGCLSAMLMRAPYWTVILSRASPPAGNAASPALAPFISST